MALEGTLKDFSIADILQLIGVQKKTGVLTLKDREEVVTVSFLNGTVVAADSLPRKLEDRLGRVLVKTGRITEEQLRKALERQKQTLLRMGHVLVNEGFIEQTDLRDALAIQVSQLIFRLFRWGDGHYHFNQEDHLDYDRKNFSPIGAETLLMEGARIQDEWPIIEKKLKSFSMIFQKVNAEIKLEVQAEDEEDFDPLSPPSGSEKKSAEDYRVTPREAIVYSLVDGKRTIQEVIDRCRLSEFDTCKCLYELLCRNLIREVSSGKEKPIPSLSKSPARSPRYSAIMGALPPISLAILLGGLLVTSAWNPLNRGNSLVAGFQQVFSDWSVASSRARLERVGYAINLYYLLHGNHPRSLEVLLVENLLRRDDLLDPWGKPYLYRALPSGFRLWGTDVFGEVRSELTLEEGIFLEPPKSAEIARNQAR
ncbi:MAG: DUF4388 domain-containing protein [Acidobacteriota bacterium]